MGAPHPCPIEITAPSLSTCTHTLRWRSRAHAPMKWILRCLGRAPGPGLEKAHGTVTGENVSTRPSAPHSLAAALDSGAALGDCDCACASHTRPAAAPDAGGAGGPASGPRLVPSNAAGPSGTVSPEGSRHAQRAQHGAALPVQAPAGASLALQSLLYSPAASSAGGDPSAHGPSASERQPLPLVVPVAPATAASCSQAAPIAGAATAAKPAAPGPTATGAAAGVPQVVAGRPVGSGAAATVVAVRPSAGAPYAGPPLFGRTSEASSISDENNSSSEGDRGVLGGAPLLTRMLRGRASLDALLMFR